MDQGHSAVGTELDLEQGEGRRAFPQLHLPWGPRKDALLCLVLGSPQSRQLQLGLWSCQEPLPTSSWAPAQRGQEQLARSPGLASLLSPRVPTWQGIQNHVASSPGGPCMRPGSAGLVGFQTQVAGMMGSGWWPR